MSFGLRRKRIGTSFKILEILMYACGFNLDSAAILVRLRRIKTKILILKQLLAKQRYRFANQPGQFLVL
jgi:hypothetical protein